jgi:hypothetical protein
MPISVTGSDGAASSMLHRDNIGVSTSWKVVRCTATIRSHPRGPRRSGRWRPQIDCPLPGDSGQSPQHGRIVVAMARVYRIFTPARRPGEGPGASPASSSSRCSNESVSARAAADAPKEGCQFQANGPCRRTKKGSGRFWRRKVRPDRSTRSFRILSGLALAWGAHGIAQADEPTLLSRTIDETAAFIEEMDGFLGDQVAVARLRARLLSPDELAFAAQPSPGQFGSGLWRTDLGHVYAGRRQFEVPPPRVYFDNHIASLETAAKLAGIDDTAPGDAPWGETCKQAFAQGLPRHAALLREKAAKVRSGLLGDAARHWRDRVRLEFGASRQLQSRIAVSRQAAASASGSAERATLRALAAYHDALRETMLAQAKKADERYRESLAAIAAEVEAPVFNVPEDAAARLAARAATRRRAVENLDGFYKTADVRLDRWGNVVRAIGSGYARAVDAYVKALRLSDEEAERRYAVAFAVLSSASAGALSWLSAGSKLTREATETLTEGAAEATQSGGGKALRDSLIQSGVGRSIDLFRFGVKPASVPNPSPSPLEVQNNLQTLITNLAVTLKQHVLDTTQALPPPQSCLWDMFDTTAQRRRLHRWLASWALTAEPKVPSVNLVARVVETGLWAEWADSRLWVEGEWGGWRRAHWASVGEAIYDRFEALNILILAGIERRDWFLRLIGGQCPDCLSNLQRWGQERRANPVRLETLLFNAAD